MTLACISESGCHLENPRDYELISEAQLLQDVRTKRQAALNDVTLLLRLHSDFSPGRQLEATGT
jgi:hypothetical protein